MEKQNLKNAGLKVTLPRMKILEILEQNMDRHMSAEDVYKALIELDQDVGLATVYRVLTQFEGAGLVTKHNFEGEHSVFELYQGTHHDHIVCVRCNKVAEFVDEKIEVLQREIALRAGYEMTDHHLYIYGVCASCREAAGKTAD